MVTALTIAGSDPTGGAGIQADLRVFEKLGVRGVSAITAITAQTEKRFLSIFPTPADVLSQQLSAALEYSHFDVIKIGMIATAANVHVVELFLKRVGKTPIVIDPVLDSSSGYPLLELSARPVFEQHLLPLATVLTPNLQEAGTLARMQVANLETMEVAAKSIYENLMRLKGKDPGDLTVIIKGGHLKDQAIDLLYDGKDFTLIDGEYINASIHGSGCRYSSALAVYLALGSDVITAAKKAKKLVMEEIKNSQLGSRCRV